MEKETKEVKKTVPIVPPVCKGCHGCKFSVVGMAGGSLLVRCDVCGCLDNILGLRYVDRPPEKKKEARVSYTG